MAVRSANDTGTERTPSQLLTGILAPAIAANGTIYFGSHDKNFYAVTPGGKLRWKFPTQSQVISSPAINSDGTVYFSSTDGNLYALNPDGSIRSPLIFDRSIKRRMSLIARSVKLSHQIYAVRNVQMCMDALIIEIASESPELQRRVLARFRQLQTAADPGAVRGLTKRPATGLS